MGSVRAPGHGAGLVATCLGSPLLVRLGQLALPIYVLQHVWIDGVFGIDESPYVVAKFALSIPTLHFVAALYLSIEAAVVSVTWLGPLAFWRVNLHGH